MQSTQVSDAGLKDLRRLKHLRYVHLGQTEISNAGLKEFKGLVLLKVVDMRGSKVTEEGDQENAERFAGMSFHLLTAVLTATCGSVGKRVGNGDLDDCRGSVGRTHGI